MMGRRTRRGLSLLPDPKPRWERGSPSRQRAIILPRWRVGLGFSGDFFSSPAPPCIVYHSAGFPARLPRVCAMGLAPLLLVASTLPAAPPPDRTAAPAAPPSVGVTAAGDDEAALKAAHLSADGPGLLQFFRRRTPPGPGGERVDDLIRQLGDK